MNGKWCMRHNGFRIEVKELICFRSALHTLIIALAMYYIDCQLLLSCCAEYWTKSLVANSKRRVLTHFIINRLINIDMAEINPN